MEQTSVNQMRHNSIQLNGKTVTAARGQSCEETMLTFYFIFNIPNFHQNKTKFCRRANRVSSKCTPNICSVPYGFFDFVLLHFLLQLHPRHFNLWKQVEFNVFKYNLDPSIQTTEYRYLLFFRKFGCKTGSWRKNGELTRSVHDQCIKRKQFIGIIIWFIRNWDTGIENLNKWWCIFQFCTERVDWIFQAGSKPMIWS